jgi:hypothetical protein
MKPVVVVISLDIMDGAMTQALRAASNRVAGTDIHSDGAPAPRPRRRP